ncbi:uncharacterized protein TEOVI_000654800 [Trypanosoma equiperdum]|uniref:Uncharacterized protein n=1 Tax=Trypanosoma equiperdum TaxID=5694 RepID=A0A1G4I4G0_TRYEQ|nr:hypothetical protein, conserved [Trypanosoma equiperdum]
MGRAVGYPKYFSDQITWYTIGYASTLSRDIFKEIVDYDPLKQLVKSPSEFRNLATYMDFRALNEDIMIGEVLRSKLKIEGLLTVDMKDCHYVMHASKDLFEYMAAEEDIIVFHHIELMHYRYLAWSHNSATKQYRVRNKFSIVDRPPGSFQVQHKGEGGSGIWLKIYYEKAPKSNEN